jgi:hypothetical protein
MRLADDPLRFNPAQHNSDVAMRFTLVLALIFVGVPAVASDYHNLRCQAVRDEVDAAQIVGWLSLGDRDHVASLIDLSVGRNRIATLLSVCAANPDALIRHVVSEFFPEIRREDETGFGAPRR